MADDSTPTSENFPALWAAHQGSLFVYILSAIPRFQDAQDVLQKVAVVAFRKQESFDPACMEFAAWVRSIARFEILHYRRDHARDRLVFSEETLSHLESAQAALGDELDERLSLLQGCLDSLRGRSRRIMELRYRHGLMPASIAEQLETSAGAIHTALAKARGVLRSCIERRLNASQG